MKSPDRDTADEKWAVLAREYERLLKELCESDDPIALLADWTVQAGLPSPKAASELATLRRRVAEMEGALHSMKLLAVLGEGMTKPWKLCPSTHCERRGECASPSDCTVKGRMIARRARYREVWAKYTHAPCPDTIIQAIIEADERMRP